MNRKNNISENDTDIFHQACFSNSSENIAYVKQSLYHTNDLCINELKFQEINMVIFYIETISDYEKIQKNILGPLSIRETNHLENMLKTIKFKQTDNLKGMSMIYIEGENEI